MCVGVGIALRATVAGRVLFETLCAFSSQAPGPVSSTVLMPLRKSGTNRLMIPHTCHHHCIMHIAYDYTYFQLQYLCLLPIIVASRLHRTECNSGLTVNATMCLLVSIHWTSLFTFLSSTSGESKYSSVSFSERAVEAIALKFLLLLIFALACHHDWLLYSLSHYCFATVAIATNLFIVLFLVTNIPLTGTIIQLL